MSYVRFEQAGDPCLICPSAVLPCSRRQVHACVRVCACMQVMVAMGPWLQSTLACVLDHLHQSPYPAGVAVCPVSHLLAFLNFLLPPKTSKPFKEMFRDERGRPPTNWEMSLKSLWVRDFVVEREGVIISVESVGKRKRWIETKSAWPSP